MIRPPGASPSTRTFLGAPPTPRFGVSEATSQTPGANAPRERDGLFDIVRWELPRTVRWRAANSAVLILRSAHAGGVSQIRTGVRASRRMRTATAQPSCFETHRSAAEA